MSDKAKKAIEEIVQEVGRYPIDAFAFIEECLSVAADTVHGPLTQEGSVVARWMADSDKTVDDLEASRQRGELPEDVAEALESVGGPESMNRHITGQQLCSAVRDEALKRWGMMARSVLGRWNITRTEDLGAIIFALVDNDRLQKQPTDKREDFDNVFSFDEAFDRDYRIETK